MGILCVFCVYDTIGNRCFEKTSFPKMCVFCVYDTIGNRCFEKTSFPKIIFDKMTAVRTLTIFFLIRLLYMHR